MRAGYVWVLTVVVGIPTFMLVTTLPQPRWRWAACRRAGRILARTSGIRVVLEGRIPDSGGLVVVANHASFLDGFALVLAIADPAFFLAGSDLEHQRVSGTFLRKLGCEFVRRGDEARRDRLAARLRDGGRLVLFPEGSLGKTPGVRPFHLGGFLAAAEGGAPVVPVGISGSRDVVRPGSKLPRRGVVRVSIGEPIAAGGRGPAAAGALRDQARAVVSALSGEPLLD